ncbi:MAG: hypothetical protein WCS92_02490 [Candidatus Babeliales bacterium]|jgi:hypothetical protein
MNFFEFTSSWLLGILTVYVTNDSGAIVQCRMALIELEKELEDLAPDNRGQSASFYGNKVIKIKDLLKNLNALHAGLFIKCLLLQECIDKSLTLILRWQDDYSAPENNIAFIRVEMRMIWGFVDLGKDTQVKMKDIQNFLYAGIIKRALMRFNLNTLLRTKLFRVLYNFLFFS